MLSLPIPKRITQRPHVTVCGSFNRHMKEVQLTIEELSDLGAQVLSPLKAKPWKEEKKGFVLLEGDRRFNTTSVRSIEDRHLECIWQSDFVVLVCPGGEIGCASAMETGFAYAGGIPVYTTSSLPIEFMAATYWVHSLQLAVMNHTTEIIA